MTKHVILTHEAPAPIGPYSQAVLAGDTLYVSGQIALDPETGELINENITEETHAVMKNMEAVLRAAGFGFEQVVKCTIFIRDMGQFGTINEAYGHYLRPTPLHERPWKLASSPKMYR